MRLSLVLAVALAASAGCAPIPPAEPVAASPLSPVGRFMAANEPGATSLLEDPEFGGEVRVTLEDAFVSAAGESCRRATVLSAAQEAEVVVICRGHDGAWTLAPRIWGRGL